MCHTIKGSHHILNALLFTQSPSSIHPSPFQFCNLVIQYIVLVVPKVRQRKRSNSELVVATTQIAAPNLLGKEFDHKFASFVLTTTRIQTYCWLTMTMQRIMTSSLSCSFILLLILPYLVCSLPPGFVKEIVVNIPAVTGVWVRCHSREKSEEHTLRCC
jgi:hypothetical protein